MYKIVKQEDVITLKKKKRMIRIAGLSAAFLLLCHAGWEISQYILHSRGTVVEYPGVEDESDSSVYSDYGFPPYKVSDETWSGEKLGDSGWTIGEKGDFLCCVCSVMEASGLNGDITPDKVNALLCELGGYDKDGEVKKGVLKAVAENVKYHNFINPGLGDDKVVRSTADPGTAYDIVRVKKGDDYRWVVIMGIYGKDYWCMDPREKEDTVPFVRSSSLARSISSFQLIPYPPASTFTCQKRPLMVLRLLNTSHFSNSGFMSYSVFTPSVNNTDRTKLSFGSTLCT